MARHYGRSMRGERCLDSVPHGHWQTATLIAALRHDGLGAPWLLDGPMNGEAFRTYLQEVLGPQLRPGDIVICDNLASHKVAGVQTAIEDRGACLFYLPAYSPDLNPIELAFAKLKAALRSAAQRNFHGLIEATASALDSFSASHCLNFLRHANYASD